jgi:hypothetical protein
MKPLERYITVVTHRVQLLSKRLEDLGRVDYPSSSPAALTDILARIAARLFDKLAMLSRNAGQRPEADVQRNLHTYNHAAVSLGRLMEAIDRAQLSSTVSVVVEALEELGSQIAFGTKTIVYPEWDYNASFVEVMSLLRPWAALIGPDIGPGIFRAAPPYLVLITYPAIEERDILHHAVLAHEMGHFIDTVYSISEGLRNEKLIEPELMDKLITLSQGKADSPPVLRAVTVIESWVQELTADLLGICLIGPCLLFAFDDVARMPHDPRNQQLSLTHPPHHLRMRYMAEAARELHLAPLRGAGYQSRTGPAEITTLDRIDAWITELVSQKEPTVHTKIVGVTRDHADLIYALGERALANAARLLRTRLTEMRSKAWFCAPTDILDAFRLETLLDFGLTPSELPDTPDRFPSFQAIMNSGCFYLLRNSEYYKYFTQDGAHVARPEIVADRYLKLQDLIAKAIETSLFRSEFMRRQGDKGGRQ